LEGTYRAIDGGDHIVAFERARGGTRLVCVAPRLPYTLRAGRHPWPLGDAWGDTAIEVGAGTWTNAFTGEQLSSSGDRLRLRDVLATFPVAWLVCTT
ncbi:MAG: malto-oligosyltrehalose synthase, partial [Deltaproteobacteria bacterium]|nr:malto-oligosyltrehalose synthase [Deltaproteobacteria bacterium]